MERVIKQDQRHLFILRSRLNNRIAPVAVYESAVFTWTYRNNLTEWFHARTSTKQRTNKHVIVQSSADSKPCEIHLFPTLRNCMAMNYDDAHVTCDDKKI